MKRQIAIVGSGPAALMAATTLLAQNRGAKVHVTLIEKRKSAGRKLLVAGSSGLNITHGTGFDSNLSSFISQYTGGSESFWKPIFEAYTHKDWIAFVEKLGFKTFLGSSNRFFLEEMKASKFLQAWVEELERSGVEFVFGTECIGFAETTLELRSEIGTSTRKFDAVCFALGGGSWEPNENPLRWPEIFISKGVEFIPFQSSNCGFKVAWTPAFLKEVEGKPIKNTVLSTAKGSRKGEMVVTQYGLEGTPVYAVGVSGVARLDLKPDLTEAQVLEKLNSSRENLSPIRRAGRYLSLTPAALALLYHFSDKDLIRDPAQLPTFARHLKNFQIQLLERQPLAEAISSSGGIALPEVDQGLMLKKFPGIFVAGEMLDWDVSTGGYLIQAAVSQGTLAARAMLRLMKIE